MINNGVLMCVWYDIVSMDFCLCVDVVGVDVLVLVLDGLIEDEIVCGILVEWILLVGFL